MHTQVGSSSSTKYTHTHAPSWCWYFVVVYFHKLDIFHFCCRWCRRFFARARQPLAILLFCSLASAWVCSAGQQISFHTTSSSVWIVPAFFFLQNLIFGRLSQYFSNKFPTKRGYSLLLFFLLVVASLFFLSRFVLLAAFVALMWVAVVVVVSFVARHTSNRVRQKHIFFYFITK